VSNWDPQANNIFLQAIEFTAPEDRSRFLDAACAANLELRARVEALIRSHERAGEFLDRPILDPTGGTGDATRTGPSTAGDGRLDFLAPSDKPGSLGRLGHYEVQEVIGRGGMGVVLKAFDENLHRVVAIKVMAPQLAAAATARARFTREARAQAAVTHDHVVTIHAVDESAGLPYLVMQYIAGVSLQDRLDRSGPLQLHVVLRIGMQAASGLAAAHAQGLVHRDVKPANILLENGVERVKLTDFGLARAADDASLTQSGVIAGTPQYMSPEQAEGKPVDARSDLFSLGSVLYAICTGRLPFLASSSMAVLKRVCEDTATPIRELNADIPDWLAELIAKLHVKDPAERFQSATEVADLLGRHLAHVQHPSVAHLPAAVKRVTHVRPARRRRRWAAAAVALVLLIAGLGTTEVIGVTKLRATVIRIFTLDGTLVVEADDPDVKIAIEGNGDLVITGAGVKEVRLAPGSYKLRATKDGKPVELDRDVVTITRGDTQVVRVRLEAEAPTAVALPTQDQPFVLLARDGRVEKPLATLDEAAKQAWNGDTIEVRGNGPYRLDPIAIDNVALCIRAGAGSWPVFHVGPGVTKVVIRRQTNGWTTGLGVIVSNSRLVLEGLEFIYSGPDPKPPSSWAQIITCSGPLHMANCRLAGNKWGLLLHAPYSPHCELRNCQLVGSAPSIRSSASSHQTVLRNNLIIARSLEVAVFAGTTATLHLTQNSLGGHIRVSRFTDAEWPAAPVTGLHIEASGNIIDSGRFALQTVYIQLPADEVKRWARWKGDHNLFSTNARLSGQITDKESRVLTTGMADWKQFWGDAETGSMEGRARYRGGDILGIAEKSPEQLTPEDCRLHPDSPGHAAGPDGKDLGADIDLVGPGPAYEKWKKTAEYRVWLNESGQKK
jgi:hypothetical protein